MRMVDEMETKIIATNGGFELCYAPDPESADYFVASQRTGLIIWEGTDEISGQKVLKDPAPILQTFPADLY
jgi:hypothetical protein